MLTLYLARRSMKALCLAKLAEPELLFFAVALAVVDAAAAVAVPLPAAVAAVLFNPRFFNEPIEPFNKSGLSTSGPPNSCNCCSQQHSIASMPSSTYESTDGTYEKYISEWISSTICFCRMRLCTLDFWNILVCTMANFFLAISTNRQNIFINLFILL